MGISSSYKLVRNSIVAFVAKYAPVYDQSGLFGERGGLRRTRRAQGQTGRARTGAGRPQKTSPVQMEAAPALFDLRLPATETISVCYHPPSSELISFHAPCSRRNPAL